MQNKSFEIKFCITWRTFCVKKFMLTESKKNAFQFNPTVLLYYHPTMHSPFVQTPLYNSWWISNLWIRISRILNNRFTMFIKLFELLVLSREFKSLQHTKTINNIKYKVYRRILILHFSSASNGRDRTVLKVLKHQKPQPNAASVRLRGDHFGQYN